ncbi:MAG: hypothetical protein KGM42_12855, partial [Hyphomicrobiales bacterium]|nr:hypothetical protein [Hyphomicrobiales bacterium]
REEFRGPTDDAGAKLSRAMIERVLTACETADSRQLGSLMALLRRFDMEAAREEAREEAERLFAERLEAPPVVLPIDDAALAAAPRVIEIDLEAIEAELAAA